MWYNDSFLKKNPGNLQILKSRKKEIEFFQLWNYFRTNLCQDRLKTLDRAQMESKARAISQLEAPSTPDALLSSRMDAQRSGSSR
jgi:hypothetical protein